MKQKALVIVGKAGSGKSYASEIASEYFPRFSFGDVIREEVGRRGLESIEENDTKIANWFHSGRERLLTARLLKKINAHLKKRREKLIIIDGPRSMAQISLLRRHFDAIVLKITLQDSVRYKREIKRKRFGEETIKKMKERDRRELSYGLAEVLKQADYSISNKCTKMQFRKRVEDFLRFVSKK